MGGFRFPKDTSPQAKARVTQWQNLSRAEIGELMRTAAEEVTAMGPTIERMQYAKYESMRSWVLGFIHRTFGLDLSDVQLLLIPRDLSLVRLAEAGGLYCKYADGAARMMWAGQLSEHAERVPGADRLVVGKCLLMYQDYPNSPAEYLRACWILWHEFGHALNDKGRLGKGASYEALAYLFELQAILAAWRDGTLARNGVTMKMIIDFLTTRVTQYSEIRMKDGQKFLAENVQPLVAQLCELGGIKPLKIGI